LKGARLCGFEPARHHLLLIEALEKVARGELPRLALEKVARGEIPRLAVFMPPGSAKSTYASVLFPPWLMAQRRG
jgi:hypothetical protein